MNGKQHIAALLDADAARFTGIADAIWGYCETRFESPRSASALAEAATLEGFRVQRGIAGMDHAFRAEWGDSGPRIGILAEYDALANLSQKAGATEKQPLDPGKPGHGCGHNLLGAGALAAAIGLKRHMEEAGLAGTVVLLGCPSEESGYGKAFMARAGVFDDLDAALTWHPMDNNAAWTAGSLAVTQVYFAFKGTSAHAAAAPELGRSALDAAELMNVGVNFLREHIIDDARIHYAFLDVGGESANVVQPTARLYYFIRAPKQTQVRPIYDRVEKIAQGAALMTETDLTVEWDSACHDYLASRSLTTLLYGNLKAVLPLDLTPDELAFAAALRGAPGDDALAALAAKIRRAHPDWTAEQARAAAACPVRTDVDDLAFTGEVMKGSTDVGDVSWITPTAQIMVACEPQGTPPHSWQWVANGTSGLAHKGMLAAAKAIAFTALDLFLDPSLVAKAKEEHADMLGGERYRSAIPPDVQPR